MIVAPYHNLLSFSFIQIDAVKEQAIKQGSSLVTKKN